MLRKRFMIKKLISAKHEPQFSGFFDISTYKICTDSFLAALKNLLILSSHIYRLKNSRVNSFRFLSKNLAISIFLDLHTY